MKSTIAFVFFHLDRPMCLNLVQMDTHVHRMCLKGGFIIKNKIFKSQTCRCRWGPLILGQDKWKRLRTASSMTMDDMWIGLTLSFWSWGWYCSRANPKKEVFSCWKKFFFSNGTFLWFLQKMVFHKAQRSKGRTLFYFSFLAIQK